LAQPDAPAAALGPGAEIVFCNLQAKTFKLGPAANLNPYLAG